MPQEYLSSPDIKAPLLLNGSAGTAGQPVVSGGSSAPPQYGTFGTAANSFCQGNDPRLSFWLVFACSDQVTALTVGTDKESFKVRKAFTLSTIPSFTVRTAPTGSALILDVMKNGTTIFSTLPRFDVSGTDSLLAATQGVLSGATSFAIDDILRVDVTQIGSTIAGAGLKCSLLGSYT